MLHYLKKIKEKLIVSREVGGFWPIGCHLITCICILNFFFTAPIPMQYWTVWFEPLTLIHSMFSHGSPAHLFGNMLFFLFAGPVCEKRLGFIRFMFLYLFSGIFGALGFGFFYPEARLIGASGAISGIMAIFPFMQRRIFSMLLCGLVTFMWFFREFDYIIDTQAGNVAHLAHIAGGVAGLVILAFYGRPRIS